MTSENQTAHDDQQINTDFGFERSEFEQWYTAIKKSSLNGPSWTESEIKQAFFRIRDGVYENELVRLRFDAWIARAALAKHKEI